MREILFRGRDIAHNWHYGVPLIFSENYVCITAPHTYNKAVQPETVGQYTGLTDKHGTKIFEGDIIKTNIYYDIGCYPYEKTEIREVKYIDGCFYPLYDNNRKKTEVIGNIHDNPELLKGGAE